MTWVFVGIHNGITLAALYRDRSNLLRKTPGFLRSLGFLLRRSSKGILGLAGNGKLACDVLGGIAHVVAIESIPQPINDHAIDHFQGSEFLSITQVCAVWGLAHALLTTGQDDLTVAITDRLVSQRDGA